MISIGPFGCMPCRIAESVLNGRLASEKMLISGHNRQLSSSGEAGLLLPFLAIETDGNAFPQLVEARLECFLLAAQRLRDALKRETILAGPAKLYEPLAGQTAGSCRGSDCAAGALDPECPAEPAQLASLPPFRKT